MSSHPFRVTIALADVPHPSAAALRGTEEAVACFLKKHIRAGVKYQRERLLEDVVMVFFQDYEAASDFRMRAHLASESARLVDIRTLADADVDLQSGID